MSKTMQDSKKEFFHKWDNTTDFEQGHTFNSYKDASKVWEYIASEISKAREEVLLELLEKKTNYKIKEVGHGYKVTQEYVLVSDIEKELSKLTTK